MPHNICTAMYVHVHMYTWLYNQNYYNPIIYTICVRICLTTFTDQMRLVTAPSKWPPAWQLTTRWMRGLLLQDVLGGTCVLASLGSLWRSASRSGLAVWRKLSEHSLERYAYVHIINHWWSNYTLQCAKCWATQCLLGQIVCMCEAFQSLFVCIINYDCGQL